MSVGIPILGNFSWYNGEMESSQFERRIFLGDTCSWWGQLEKNEKLKTFKFESLKWNWKEWSWKFRAKVGNFWITWHCLKTFQLRLVLVNFDGNFLTTDFQIQNFPTSRFSNVSLREIEVGENQQKIWMWTTLQFQWEASNFFLSNFVLNFTKILDCSNFSKYTFSKMTFQLHVQIKKVHFQPPYIS